MTGTSLTANGIGTGLTAPRPFVRRVEKPRDTSNLGDSSMQGQQRDTQSQSRFATSRTLSRSETPQASAPWHGTVLQPAFVAQVLGQIMPANDRSDPRSAFAAYEDGAASRAALRVLDRNI